MVRGSQYGQLTGPPVLDQRSSRMSFELVTQDARATARRHETAIRTAMGAGSWRLTQLWLVESALLGLCSAILGIALAAALCRLLPAVLPVDFPRID